MNLKIIALPVSTIEAFAEAHDLTMVVKQRHHFDEEGKWYAQFDGVSVCEDSMLRGTYGNGRTPDEAIKNYVLEISEKRIAINGLDRAKRREITIPKLI